MIKTKQHQGNAGRKDGNKTIETQMENDKPW